MNVKYMNHTIGISLTTGIVPTIARRIPRAYGITSSDVAVALIAYLATPKSVRDSARTAYANGDALAPQRVSESSPTITLEYDGRYITDDVVSYITTKIFDLDLQGVIKL
jgi:hypothetical protein